MPTDPLQFECLAGRRELTIRQVSSADRRSSFGPENLGFEIQGWRGPEE